MLLEYCSECGSKITDEAMADGAVRVGKNTYLCVKCVKSGVLKTAGVSGAASASRPARTASRPPSQPLSNLPGSRPRPAAKPSKMPMFIAAGGVFLLGAGILLVALRPGESPESPKPEAPTEKPPEAEKKSVETKSETPAPNAEYDPRASVGSSKLEQAKSWFKDHQDDVELYRDKLEDIRTGYARTPAADEAARIVGTLKMPVSAPADGAPAEGAWAAALDLLAPIDVKLDSVRGEWTRNNSALISDQKLGGKTTMLALPYVPPDEYDLRIAATRTWGNDALGVRIPRGEHNVEFVLAGWRDTLQGFERVKGERVLEAGANFRQDGLIKNTQPFTLILQVRRKIIKAYVDGRMICELRASPKDVSACDRDWSSPYHDRINIGTWESSYEIKRIDLIEQTGKGRIIPAASRPEPQRGLWASYFSSEKEPDPAAAASRFKNHIFSRTERNLNWDVGDGRVDHDIHHDHFDIRYAGNLKVKQPGKHRFHLNVDDVVLLYIDGKEIGKTGPAMSDNQYEVDLTPGDHTFRMDFTEYGGAASMHVQWEQPGQPRADIPVDQLWYDPTKIESYKVP